MVYYSRIQSSFQTFLIGDDVTSVSIALDMTMNLTYVYYKRSTNK